jgi:hypothetical protein
MYGNRSFGKGREQKYGRDKIGKHFNRVKQHDATILSFSHLNPIAVGRKVY